MEAFLKHQIKIWDLRVSTVLSHGIVVSKEKAKEHLVALANKEYLLEKAGSKLWELAFLYAIFLVELWWEFVSKFLYLEASTMAFIIGADGPDRPSWRWMISPFSLSTVMRLEWAKSFLLFVRRYLVPKTTASS